MAERKVRFYDWNKSVVAEGVIPLDQPPQFLAFENVLYEFGNETSRDTAVYRRCCALPEVQVTYHRGVPRG